MSLQAVKMVPGALRNFVRTLDCSPLEHYRKACVQVAARVCLKAIILRAYSTGLAVALQVC
jgi:hypothetical protein